MSQPQYRLTKGAQGYYRPNAQGYTSDKAEAGLFSLDEAMSHCLGSHGEVTKELVEAPEVGFSILADNLEAALICAIDSRSQREKEWGYFAQSAYLAGLESNLAYLRKHGTLEVRS